MPWAPSSTCRATASEVRVCSSEAAPISWMTRATVSARSLNVRRVLTVEATVVPPCSMASSVWEMRAPISLAAPALRSASLRTSSATTAKPLPWTPALAASMAALRESRFVWRAISWITFTAWTIFWLASRMARIASTEASPSPAPTSASLCMLLVCS